MFYRDERRDKGGHRTGFIRTRRETREVTSQVASGREKERVVGSSHRLYQDERGRQGRLYHQSGKRDQEGPTTGCISQGEIKQIQVGFLASLYDERERGSSDLGKCCSELAGTEVVTFLPQNINCHNRRYQSGMKVTGLHTQRDDN